MQFYLRIEGVNLGNFIYDVDDLSTVRGGSLLLLDAVQKAHDVLQGIGSKARPLSTGASAGLFRFDASDESAAIETRRTLELEIRNALPALTHATFVVDVMKAGRDDQFRCDSETILALNRWRQMRAPSVAVPAEGNDDGRVCELDLVRPATGEELLKGKTHRLSHSTAERRRYGTEQKREFYTRIVKAKNLPSGFVNDLDQLSAEESQGSLHHKIAVIYIDGNDFGRFRKTFDKPSRQEAWDKELRGKREELLRQLMKTLREESGKWTSRDWMFLERKVRGRESGAASEPEAVPKLRFETLLWGGDELMWVVPAWQAWRTLSFFFDHAQWRFHGEDLKHAASLVLCHHDAPIHRITKLAKDLCDLAKSAGKDQNRIAYQVLESFDHTGDDLEGFRAGRLPPDSDRHALVLPGDAMRLALGVMARFKGEFPKRKLHEIVALLLDGKTEAAVDLAEKTLAPLSRASEALAAMTPCFGISADVRHPERWLHLLDLWDYID